MQFIRIHHVIVIVRCPPHAWHSTVNQIELTDRFTYSHPIK